MLYGQGRCAFRKDYHEVKKAYANSFYGFCLLHKICMCDKFSKVCNVDLSEDVLRIKELVWLELLGG